MMRCAGGLMGRVVSWASLAIIGVIEALGPMA
jgi:hypothetical protein